MSVVVQLDCPNNRDLSRIIRMPVVPREGDSMQIGDISGRVRHVVWFINDGVLVRVVVDVPEKREDADGVS